MSEITTNMLGVAAAQPKRDPGTANRVQGATEVTVAAGKKTAEVQASSQSEAAVVSEKQLEEMVDDLNGLAQSVQRQLQFNIDDDNGKVYVKVVDKVTNDVIREIPSEDIRDMQKHLKEASEALFRATEGTSLLFRGEA